MVQYKARVVLVSAPKGVMDMGPYTRTVLFQDAGWQESDDLVPRDRILTRDDVRATLVALKDGEELEVSVAVVPFRIVE